jgi:hypothetical protein
MVAQRCLFGSAHVSDPRSRTHSAGTIGWPSDDMRQRFSNPFGEAATVRAISSRHQINRLSEMLCRLLWSAGMTTPRGAGHIPAPYLEYLEYPKKGPRSSLRNDQHHTIPIEVIDLTTMAGMCLMSSSLSSARDVSIVRCVRLQHTCCSGTREADEKHRRQRQFASYTRVPGCSLAHR